MMGGNMNTLQKTICPAATGQSAEKNTDTAIFSQPVDLGKAEATLMAQLALKGHAVYRVAQDTRISHPAPKDSYIVTRWGMVRHCTDLEALEAFARQVGATSP